VNKRNQVLHTKAEREILGMAQCPFVVEMHYAFQTPEKLYLVMDFLNGGELFFHMQREGFFDERRIQFYAAELVLALDYLHSIGVVYRDLKPENVLMGSDGHLKLTDFGLSKKGIFDLERDKAFTICGTAEYLAPEIILGQGHGVAADWWSLGILIYEMYVGITPFQDANKINLMRAIIKKKVNFSPFKRASPELLDLVRRLLTQQPRVRLGARGAKDIKKHPFFKGLDWEALAKKAIKPPFLPTLKGEADLSCIDKQFLKEKAVDSPTALQLATPDRHKLHFEEFTYTKPEIVLRFED